MDALEIKTLFAINIAGFSIPITETVVVSWAIMFALIVGSLILRSHLRLVPQGPQAIMEVAVDFLNNFAKNQFGRFAKVLGPYIGSLFLFLFVANIISIISPVEVKAFGFEFVPPFVIRPPARDINVTAAFAVISVLLVIVCGFAARGVGGWFKRLLHPLPLMLPFNIMEYGTRLISLALRLFGNILGGLVLMTMLEGVLPVLLPAVMCIYLDLFDGIMQAFIFVFLTSLYIGEAVKVNEE
jgi:F-type H+-transporting ATPase subunit a